MALQATCKQACQEFSKPLLVSHEQLLKLLMWNREG
jgi:hypothetical protein